MSTFKPDEEFIKRSQERLTHLFQEKFKQRVAARNEKLADDKVTLQIFRNLAKGNKDIAKVGEKVYQKVLDHMKQPLPELKEATIERGDFHTESGGGSIVGFVRSAPYDWPWVTKGQSDSANFGASADKDGGILSFDGWTGEDGGSASGAGAVGFFFQPKAAGTLLQVFANPSLVYAYDAYRFIDAVRSHAWVGIYVSEFTLDGRFVRTAIDQQISLWTADYDVGSFSGSNSAFPLFASGSADNNHFYEIWVWAGADVEGSGYYGFDWSHSFAQLSVHVPSISTFFLG